LTSGFVATGVFISVVIHVIIWSCCHWYCHPGWHMGCDIGYLLELMPLGIDIWVVIWSCFHLVLSSRLSSGVVVTLCCNLSCILGWNPCYHLEIFWLKVVVWVVICFVIFVLPWFVIWFDIWSCHLLLLSSGVAVTCCCHLCWQLELLSPDIIIWCFTRCCHLWCHLWWHLGCHPFVICHLLLSSGWSSFCHLSLVIVFWSCCHLLLSYGYLLWYNL
jgi:hypothetical protein